MANDVETLVLGGGCFWCTDAAFRLVRGVNRVTAGFSGGHVDNPSYTQVAMQLTGHAEVIQIEYHSDEVSLNDLLEVFWIVHDPTTRDRQGHDVGPQYRSIIFYQNEEQKKVIEQSRVAAQKLWDQPIVTEIVKFEKFWPADESHQDFFNKNPEQAYCQIIINPKLTKLRQKLAGLLKT
ncbi:MAG TPA: peptide-methionine (S)-S-oxide reductase MsrA [Candidatus Saccharimonadales bacterium]|nr:peptide-methionine (S)-S-oxide reductase MsrA [Candidatus Saccharimonadales bacterium]